MDSGRTSKIMVLTTKNKLLNIQEIQNIFRVDIQLYQHEWNWKNEKLCGNTTPAGRTEFRVFRQFPRVLK